MPEVYDHTREHDFPSAMKLQMVERYKLSSQQQANHHAAVLGAESSEKFPHMTFEPLLNPRNPPHDVIINDSEDKSIIPENSPAWKPSTCSLSSNPSPREHFHDELKEFTIIKFGFKHIKSDNRRVTAWSRFEECTWLVHPFKDAKVASSQQNNVIR